MKTKARRKSSNVKDIRSREAQINEAKEKVRAEHRLNNSSESFRSNNEWINDRAIDEAQELRKGHDQTPEQAVKRTHRKAH